MSIIYKGVGTYNGDGECNYQVVLPTAEAATCRFDTTVYNCTKNAENGYYILIFMFSDNPRDFSGDTDICIKNFTFNLNKLENICGDEMPAERIDIATNPKINVIIYHDNSRNLEEACEKFFVDRIRKKFIPKASGLGTIKFKSL